MGSNKSCDFSLLVYRVYKEPANIPQVCFRSGCVPVPLSQPSVHWEICSKHACCGNFAATSVFILQRLLRFIFYALPESPLICRSKRFASMGARASIPSHCCTGCRTFEANVAPFCFYDQKTELLEDLKAIFSPPSPSFMGRKLKLTNGGQIRSSAPEARAPL